SLLVFCSNKVAVKKKYVRPMLNMEFPHHLNSMQQLDLEAEVSNEEIKKAVWDCGVDKSPGPDGFTFGFYKRFWSLIEKDMLAAMKYFFHYSRIPKGCNSSFIALIQKTPEAKMVKDFRPISFIGSLYKIIAKILANRLVMVLGDIVNEVQSAFVADRQILDGPFILNEVLQWCSKVGGNMSRIKSWDEIVDKMVDRLSKWKMKTLSIGGRLTLLKAVLGFQAQFIICVYIQGANESLQRMGIEFGSRCFQ
ncbi:hypothetical protein Tco_1065178, partial [Tanacetum coccineum]